MTPALVSAINEYQRQAPTSIQEQRSNSEPSMDDPAVGKPVSHGQVIEISRWLRERENAHAAHLDDLLRGSKVYVEPSKPRAEPTSEYKALMSRLRRQEEARAYERMLNPALALETFAQRFPGSTQNSTGYGGTPGVGEDIDEVTYAEVNNQVALIVNVLVSIVACSVAIWMATSHWSSAKRLAMSMSGSGVVGIAEVVVYAGYLRRVNEAKQNEKKKAETKEVVKTWVLDKEWKSSGVRHRKQE